MPPPNKPVIPPLPPYTPARKRELPKFPDLESHDTLAEAVRDAPIDLYGDRATPAMPPALPVAGNLPVHQIPANALKWLQTIGGELGRLDNISGFHRNSPTAGVLSPSKDFIVYFDAATGEPTGIAPGCELPFPEILPPGIAAAHVNYLEITGLGFISVRKQTAATRVSQAAYSVLHMIEGRTPALSEAAPAMIDLPGGVQLIVPVDGVDAHNREFAEKMMSGMRYGAMTVMVKKFPRMTLRGQLAFSEWLAHRVPDAQVPMEKIAEHVQRRAYGQQQHDISIDASGRFVGDSAHMPAEHSPRGTTYTMGASNMTESRARNVMFEDVVQQDGTIIKVPVSYEWEGPMGAAHHAFERWFNSPEYVRLRQSVFTDARMTDAMFQGTNPRERLAALLAHLDKDAQLEKRMKKQALSAGITPSEHKAYVDELRGYLTAPAIAPTDELEISYLEMMMRKAAGDPAIDTVCSTLKVSPAGGFERAKSAAVEYLKARHPEIMSEDKRDLYATMYANDVADGKVLHSADGAPLNADHMEGIVSSYERTLSVGRRPGFGDTGANERTEANPTYAELRATRGFREERHGTVEDAEGPPTERMVDPLERARPKNVKIEVRDAVRAVKPRISRIK